MKKSKLSTLTVLAGFTYILMIVSYFAYEWEDFMMGYREGYEETRNGLDKTSLKDVDFISLAPNDDIFYFPEKILNKKTEKMIDARYSRMKVYTSKDIKRSPKVKIYSALQILIFIIMSSIYLFIPFQFYSLLTEVRSGKLFDNETIKRFKKIGLAVILLYFSMTAFALLEYEIITSKFQFENYKIVRDKVELFWLLLGVVLLLIHEIMVRGVALKKEQELTI